ERALIRERQKEGIAIARQSNTYKGRKPIFTNEQQAEIKQMVADRYKVTEIAKKFNVSRATIYNYLASKD
ncbi:MAG: Hin recombinase, partial [Burkholderiales bacterium]|nr:Hin recombinase [Burkholderiales bacterium]